jgi:hypothetical protein
VSYHEFPLKKTTPADGLGRRRVVVVRSVCRVALQARMPPRRRLERFRVVRFRVVTVMVAELVRMWFGRV